VLERRASRRAALGERTMVQRPQGNIDQPARIDRFMGEYRFLSNFFRSAVRDERGIEYPTVEHAYQASKATRESDRERIAAAKHPSKAKRLGHRLSVDPAWHARKDEVMRRLLVQKFAPGTELAARLTATGSAELLEGNAWGDTYWGVVDGVGENRLGRMLMEIRSQLNAANAEESHA
jgi:ribA/ribD-fused uncharacterized protein